MNHVSKLAWKAEVVKYPKPGVTVVGSFDFGEYTGVLALPATRRDVLPGPAYVLPVDAGPVPSPRY